MTSGRRIYLDYNASAPLLDCAREAMLGAMQTQANPSSVHQDGRNALAAIERARSQLGQLTGVRPGRIIFTSSASEAANHALSPVIRAAGREICVSKLMVSAVEHPCLLSGGRFAADALEFLPVHPNGLLDMDALESALAAHDRKSGELMVAVQLANNETGIIQPIAEIARLVHAANGFFVVDAVQALGKIKFTIDELAAHFVIVSSHKIGGPQGAAALILGDASIAPMPLIAGGGQENYQRAGTQNVAAIAGFGAACEWHFNKLDQNGNNFDLRAFIETELVAICKNGAQDRANGFRIFGEDVMRLPNTTAFALAGIKAETALIALDLAGISVSSGSACSSGKVRRSPVLAAMGVEEELLQGAIRISIGEATTRDEAMAFLDAWKTIVNRLARAA